MVSIPNPYTQQLGQLPQLGGDARSAINQIYKNLGATITPFNTQLQAEDKRRRQDIANLISRQTKDNAALRQTGIADILRVAGQSSGTVDDAEKAFLSNLVGRKQEQFNTAGLADLGARGAYQGSIKKLDTQLVRDLRASAIREKQARQAELEQNLLGFGTSLRTNAALFDAQMQQLNQTQGVLDQGIGSVQGGGGGGIQQSNGSYRVGQASGLSAAEAWIIQHESGGDPMAQNPHSTAHGIGQFLDSTDRAYSAKLGFPYRTTDPAQQLAMFRAYIRDRYGTAENAQRFWQANGWY